MASMPRDERAMGGLVAAAILIVIGCAALLANLTGLAITAESIPLGIGLVFLVAYVMTRTYGVLVPAGVLTGFGAGVFAASLFDIADSGALIVMGGGLGFLFIYIVDVVVSGSAARWWPVIPGGILTLVGTGLAQQNDALRQLALWWPLLLIAFGVLMLIERYRGHAPAK